MAANLPNVVSQLNTALIANATKIGYRLLLVEGLLDKEFLQLNLVHITLPYTLF